MARGWAVIAPSRRGRGGSQGVDEEGSSCSEAAAAAGADRALAELEAVTPLLIAQPFVDRSRIAVGGLADSRRCRIGRAINLNLLKHGVTWGQPSLWLYGDKDLFYPLEDTKANFDAFVAAGGKGVWHDYMPPGEGLQGHEIHWAPELWSVDMEAYLAERSLPSKHAN